MSLNEKFSANFQWGDIMVNVVENFEKKELFFVHIPKNAGTSIENAALRKGIKWGRHFDFKSAGVKSKALDNSSVWHVPPKWTKEGKEVYFSKGKVPFAVVRNPYDRFVSEYNYTVEKSPGWAKDFLTERNPNDPKSVNDFADILSLAVRIPGLNGCHFAPQTKFTEGVKEILRFENLQDDFTKLLKKYHYPKLKLEKNNKSVKVAKVSDLTPRSRQIVWRVYQDDFKAFGYDK